MQEYYDKGFSAAFQLFLGRSWINNFVISPKSHDAWHSNIDKKWEVSICPHRDCAVPQSSPMYLQKHAEIWNYSLLQWQDILSGECNFSPFEEYFKQNLDKLCLTLPWFGYGPFFMSPCLKKSNLNGRLWWARGRSWGRPYGGDVKIEGGRNG